MLPCALQQILIGLLSCYHRRPNPSFALSELANSCTLRIHELFLLTSIFEAFATTAPSATLPSSPSPVVATGRRHLMRRFTTRQPMHNVLVALPVARSRCVDATHIHSGCTRYTLMVAAAVLPLFESHTVLNGVVDVFVKLLHDICIGMLGYPLRDHEKFA